MWGLGEQITLEIQDDELAKRYSQEEEERHFLVRQGIREHCYTPFQ
jgi:hypothetical protein